MSAKLTVRKNHVWSIHKLKAHVSRLRVVGDATSYGSHSLIKEGVPYGAKTLSVQYSVGTLRRRIFFFCDFQDFVLCSDISWYKIRNSLRSQFHLDSSMGITSAIDDEISGQTSAMAHQFEKE